MRLCHPHCSLGTGSWLLPHLYQWETEAEWWGQTRGFEAEPKAAVAKISAVEKLQKQSLDYPMRELRRFCRNPKPSLSTGPQGGQAPPWEVEAARENPH